MCCISSNSIVFIRNNRFCCFLGWTESKGLLYWSSYIVNWTPAFKIFAKQISSMFIGWKQNA